MKLENVSMPRETVMEDETQMCVCIGF